MKYVECSYCDNAGETCCKDCERIVGKKRPSEWAEP